MRKGKLGIAFAFYAAAAFVLAMFSQTTVLALLTAFVLLVEADEWASKQCIQALVIVALKWVISEVFSLIYYPINWIGYFITDYESGYYTFTSVLNKITSFAQDVIGIAILVFVVIAIISVLKEKSAKFPLAAQVADWAYGKASPSTKKCPKCGAELSGKFCDQCGTKVED